MKLAGPLSVYSVAVHIAIRPYAAQITLRENSSRSARLKNSFICGKSRFVAVTSPCSEMGSLKSNVLYHTFRLYATAALVYNELTISLGSL